MYFNILRYFEKNYNPINQMFLSLVSGCLAHNTPSARPQPSEALNSLYLSPPGNGGTLFGLRKFLITESNPVAF